MIRAAAGLLVLLWALPLLSAETVTVTLAERRDHRLLGVQPEQGIVIQALVTWREPGTLIDTVGIARAEPGNVQLRVLENGALQLGVFLGPSAAGVDRSGWQRLSSGARLARGQPQMVTLILGPAAHLFVLDQLQGRLDGPAVWPAQPIYVGDFPGDAGLGDETATALSMLGEVEIGGFAPGSHDLQITTLHRRAQALAAEQPEEALWIARLQVDLSPKSAAGLLCRAQARVRLGDAAGALADCEQALATEPENPSAYHQRGRARLQLGDVDGARADYRKSLSLRDDSVVRSELQALEEQTARALPKGGFDPAVLPPVREATRRTIAAKEGGALALPGGARLELPEGALAADTDFTFQELETAMPGTALYHVAAGVTELKRPAELALPVDAAAFDEPFRVRVFHFHEQEDLGRELEVDWKPGDAFARVRLERLSLVLKVYEKFGSNDPDVLMEWLKEAFEGHDPEKFLAVPVYRQNRTLLCWAAALAMVIRSNRPLAEFLESPHKPQSIAGLADISTGDSASLPTANEKVVYLTTRFSTGMPMWRLLRGNASEPFASLGADFEIKRWILYRNLTEYLIDQLAKGYPVALYSQADAHFRVVVGYDPGHVIVNDPAAPNSPIWIPWRDFFRILTNTASETFNGVWTMVQPRPIVYSGPLTLNVPSCAVEPRVNREFNRHGAYFTAPHAKEPEMLHVGYRWYGYNGERFQGMLLSTSGEFKWHVDPLGVGQGTVFAYRGVQIMNNTAQAHACAVEVVLVDPKDGQEIELCPRREVSAQGNRGAISAKFPDGVSEVTAQGETTEVDAEFDKLSPLLELLPKEKRGPRKYVIRFRLLQNGAEVDRVEIPAHLHPFRLESIEAAAGGGGEFEVLGSGLSYVGVQGDVTPKPVGLVIVDPAGKERDVALTVKNDERATFRMPEGVSTFTRAFLRAGDGLRSNDLDTPASAAPLPPAVRATITFGFEGTQEKTRLVLDEESEDRRMVPAITVEPLELDVRHGGLSAYSEYDDMPVTVQGPSFSCAARIKERDFRTEFSGTFAANGRDIESLTIRHRHRNVTERVFDRKAMEARDGQEHTEEYTITVTGLKPGPAEDGISSYAVDLGPGPPLAIRYSVERKVYTAMSGELDQAGGWSCGKGQIEQGFVRLVFRSEP